MWIWTLIKLWIWTPKLRQMNCGRYNFVASRNVDLKENELRTM